MKFQCFRNLTFRVPERDRKDYYAFSETCVMDMKNFKMEDSWPVYYKEYVLTKKMSEEELKTFLGYIEIAGADATFKEYSALIRSPPPLPL